jgi:coenzyme F420-reducing hydrogenase delta subunit
MCNDKYTILYSYTQECYFIEYPVETFKRFSTLKEVIRELGIANNKKLSVSIVYYY